MIYLTREQERRARQYADISHAGFWILFIALCLVGAFTGFMLWPR